MLFSRPSFGAVQENQQNLSFFVGSPHLHSLRSEGSHLKEWTGSIPGFEDMFLPPSESGVAVSEHRVVGSVFTFSC